MASVSLPVLIDDVAQHTAASPLDRIEAALSVSEELQSTADELVAHFVMQGRQQGCSWTEIGARLGVSKQAARQRFARQRCHISAPRSRRRRGKKADQRCSFCGKSGADGVELVAGPGVWICAACVHLADEIIAERAAERRVDG